MRGCVLRLGLRRGDENAHAFCCVPRSTKSSLTSARSSCPALKSTALCPRTTFRGLGRDRAFGPRLGVRFKLFAVFALGRVALAFVILGTLSLGYLFSCIIFPLETTVLSFCYQSSWSHSTVPALCYPARPARSHSTVSALFGTLLQCSRARSKLARRKPHTQRGHRMNERNHALLQQSSMQGHGLVGF